MGAKIADAPIINNTLAMLLPTTLPNAISGRSPITAFIETNNSGADVPKPTTTTPARNGETFRRVAMANALRTKKSPPNVSKNSPAITIMNEIIMV